MRLLISAIVLIVLGITYLKTFSGPKPSLLKIRELTQEKASPEEAVGTFRYVLPLRRSPSEK